MTLLIGLTGEADFTTVGRGVDFVAATLTPTHLVQEGGKWADVRALARLHPLNAQPAFARGVQIALLDPVRVFARDMFGLSLNQVWGPTELQDDVDAVYGVSPRAIVSQCEQLMRRLSTTVLTDRLVSTIGALMTETALLCPARPGSYEMRRFDTFVVTDVHEVADAQAICEMGGVLLRLCGRHGESLGAPRPALQKFISASIEVSGASLDEIRSEVLAQLRLCGVEVCDD